MEDGKQLIFMEYFVLIVYLLTLYHNKSSKFLTESVGHDDLAAIAVIMYFGGHDND